MKRVLVIGCPGAGKSTFARKLRDRTGLPLYYLDLLWHRPDRTTASREEFSARLEKILSQERWIIDGNYLRTLDPRLRACDTVFLLDFPLEACLAGAESRIGKAREDMGGRGIRPGVPAVDCGLSGSPAAADLRTVCPIPAWQGRDYLSLQR